ncbi:MAG: CoA-binding protein [Nanoarchaeota archaeon]|nr:CoA-binding protein [Nanoarchaeota archaeon]
MIDKNYRIAVVGASNNPMKYGNIVMRDLITKGYNVVPVHPSEKIILKIPVYRNLKAVMKNINLVIFVVPPKITEKVLIDVKEMKIPKVWMQPGSESLNAIKFCEDNKIECIHNSCIMFK